MTACCAYTDGSSIRLKVCSSIAPKSAMERTKSVALAVFVGLSCLAIVTAISYAISKRYPSLQMKTSGPCRFRFFEKYPTLQTVWRAVWRLFAVGVAPIVEEILFRGVINDKIAEWTGDQGVIRKVARIFFVSALFGAAHLNPFQSRANNLTSFCITASLGVVFALLKEARGDLVTPMVAHAVYNLGAIF